MDDVEQTPDSQFIPEEKFPTEKFGDVPSQDESKHVSSTCDKKECSSVTWFKNLDPRVVRLLYWRDLKKSGSVFGTVFALLLSLNCFSVISVLSYLSLAILTLTLSFRGYKSLLQAVQKTNDPHPFKEYLDMDVEYPRETIDKVIDKLDVYLNRGIRELRRLFLVEDVLDSLKFFLIMWVATYIGAWFSLITLLILAYTALFTVPKVYEVYQAPIDQYTGLIRSRLADLVCKAQERVPLLKKLKTQ